MVQAGLFLSALALPAAAERARIPVTFHADGGVTHDGIRYPTVGDWHRSRAFQDSGARCGSVAPPAPVEASPTDCSFDSTTIQDEYDPGEIIEIAVVYHVVENTSGEGRVSEELLASQIEILNEDFEALVGTPGADGTPGAIRFVLATVDPDGNPTTGINRVVNNNYYEDGPGMKAALAWDPDLYFNVYTNTASGYLGYASFPQIHAGDPSEDGVVLGHWFVGRDAPEGDVYDQGRTLTHEAGHYLGLFHTFEGECSGGYTGGDLLADTPMEDGPRFGCPVGEASGCGGTAPIENYMDYSDDTCMTHFTPEQVNRMRCSLVNYRPTFGNDWPVAGFTYTTEDGFAFDFTDASTDDGGIVSRQWDLGDGTTATTTEVSHTFEPGTYEVSLLVEDEHGAKRRYVQTIVADPPPTAAFRSEPDGGLNVQFHDESTDPNGSVVAWAWDFGDGTTSTEKDPAHLYEEVGTYTVTLTVTDEAGASATVDEEIVVAEDEGGCCSTSEATTGQLAGQLGLLLGVGLLALRRRRR
jgi:PKD repeat protein